MGEVSSIAWTHATFNPWIGCTKVSGACKHCYAEALDKRWGHARWGPGAARERTSASYWLQPLRWDRAAAKAGVRRRVFCASLADVVPWAEYRDPRLRGVRQFPEVARGA